MNYCVQTSHVLDKLTHIRTRFYLQKILRKVYGFEQGLRSKLSTLEQRIINLHQLTWF